MTDFELPEIVYHGTVSVHKESIESGIDINKGYKSVDFGQGFYTTPDYHQALNIALARTNAYNLRHKKGSVAYPMVITFHLDREGLNAYKGLIFEKADDRWKEFVFNNRVGIDFSVSKFYNKSGKYSYVYGFVADSNITEMVGSIREGRSSFGEFADKLKPLKSNSYVQLSFHSSEVVKLLTLDKIDIIDKEVAFYG